MPPPQISTLAKSEGGICLLYMFNEVGDTLEIHNHSFMHRAVIMPGSKFEWMSPSKRGTVESLPGQPIPKVLTFPAGVLHGMIALQAGSSFYTETPDPVSSS